MTATTCEEKATFIDEAQIEQTLKAARRGDPSAVRDVALKKDARLT